jgi:glucose/arabinose dehydrogenase
VNRLRILPRPLFSLWLALFLALGAVSPAAVLALPLAQEAPLLEGPHVLIVRNVNVRSGPSTQHTVLGVTRPGQHYTVTGKNADGSWWRIDYLGREGWLYAPLVQPVNVDGVAVVEAGTAGTEAGTAATPAQAPASSADGATVSIIRRMNVRSGPGTNYSVLTTALPGEQYTVTGKNTDGSWWRIDRNGRAGWVFGSLVQARNVADVPVAQAESAPAATQPAASPAQTTRFNPQQVEFRLEPVFSGLRQPTQVTHAGDGSGRFFVVERAGIIRVYSAPQTDGSVFLDIRDRVGDSGYEQGLLGLAFPPNFSRTGYFFINYTNNSGDTVIARYRVGDNHNRANPDSEFGIMTLQQPAPNHNGGMLAFGPDGYLWIGTGDGGGANDTFQNGQNPGSLLGAMLRIDVTSDPSVRYRIPPDNPWINRTWQGQEVRDEIWAIGFRNPWRYSFDRRTGDLWIADVGQSLFEEINYVPARQLRQGGLNFGWPLMEGKNCRNEAGCPTESLFLPVLDYGHAGNGCSVTGGYVYRGQAYPMLDGVYFFADFCSGNVWTYWRPAGVAGRMDLILPKAAAISSFGEDEAGELYVTDFGGGVVYRIAVGR